MNVSRRYLGDVFTIIVLVLGTGALQSLIVDSSSSKAISEGNPFLQVVWACIYVITAIRAGQQPRAILEMIRSNKLLIGLVLLTFFSAAWSADPGLTLRRSIALLATTLFGVDFAVRYSLRDQLRLLAVALGGVVLLSVIVQVFFPGQIPTVDMLYPDAWVGLFGQKNEFGRIVVLATLVVLTAVRKSVGGIIITFLALVAAIGLIIAAQSMTSFVALVGMILVMQFAPTLRWSARIRRAVQVFGTIIALPAFYALIHFRDSVTELMGRNASLTGRVKIWGLSVASIALKPILGYGYSAFWPASAEAMRIDVAINWTVPHAHDAYIELALELGLVGLGLYVGAYLLAMKRAAWYMRMERDNSAKWPLVYLCFVLLYSFTENYVLAPNTIFWMLFVAASCTISQPVGAPELVEDDEGEPEADAGPSFATS
jgi:exopolysaccharide production protein ExoQ